VPAVDRLLGVSGPPLSVEPKLLYHSREAKTSRLESRLLAKASELEPKSRIKSCEENSMSAAIPLSYDQPISAHYEVIFASYLQRNNERPHLGWKRVVLHLSTNAQRVESSDQNRFMEELLRLIREKCSGTEPKDVSPQGLWIDRFEGSDLVNRYLQGATVKIYPGESSPQSVWIDVAPTAGAFSGGGFFRA